MLMEGRQLQGADSALRVRFVTVIFGSSGVGICSSPKHKRNPFQIPLFCVKAKGDIGLFLEAGKAILVALENSKSSADPAA